MVLTTTPVELVFTEASPTAFAVEALLVAATGAVTGVELVVEVGAAADTAAALVSGWAAGGLVAPLGVMGAVVVAPDAAPVGVVGTGKRAGSVVWMMGTNGAVVMGAPRTSPTMPTVVNVPVMWLLALLRVMVPVPASSWVRPLTSNAPVWVMLLLCVFATSLPVTLLVPKSKRPLLSSVKSPSVDTVPRFKALDV